MLLAVGTPVHLLLVGVVLITCSVVSERRETMKSSTEFYHALSELTEFYHRVLPMWVGGYTVHGTAINATGALEDFAVKQECLCEVKATSHGVYARGANADNAFSLIAALEPDGLWHAQQRSIGAAVPYQAAMGFGEVAGGKHSAVGYELGGATEATFRAEQSAIGCAEGVGVAACERVCAAQSLTWAQIRERCQEFGGLHGQVLTDFAQPAPAGHHGLHGWRTTAALFSVKKGADAQLTITLYGSDDGSTFWTLHGAFVGSMGEQQIGTRRRLIVDFSPKAGPRDLGGTWLGDRIVWDDGNQWAPDAPPCVFVALTKQESASACWRAGAA